MADELSNLCAMAIGEIGEEHGGMIERAIRLIDKRFHANDNPGAADADRLFPMRELELKLQLRHGRDEPIQRAVEP